LNTFLQEEENEKMITLQQIDKLIETKFAKFENRIVKSFTNSIDDTSGVIKEVKLNVPEKQMQFFLLQWFIPLQQFHLYRLNQFMMKLPTRR